MVGQSARLKVGWLVRPKVVLKVGQLVGQLVDLKVDH